MIGSPHQFMRSDLGHLPRGNDKMDKEAETRIRTRKEPGVKVNKALAKKILRDEEKAKARAERKSKHKTAADIMDIDEAKVESSRPNILSDPRFSKVFEDPAFAIDETTREYALLNPSSFAQNTAGRRGKTAVEEEEEESDKVSSDGLGGSDDESDGKASDVSSDSSAEGGAPPLSFVDLLIDLLIILSFRTY